MRRLTLALTVAAAAVLAVGRPLSGWGAEADPTESKKPCGCPVMPGERILLPCKSVVRPDACGACSVLTDDGKRTGRPCVTLPYEPAR